MEDDDGGGGTEHKDLQDAISKAIQVVEERMTKNMKRVQN